MEKLYLTVAAKGWQSLHYKCLQTLFIFLACFCFQAQAGTEMYTENARASKHISYGVNSWQDGPVADPACRVLDFDGEAAGFITQTSVGEGNILINGRKRNMDGSYAAENHASIFNTLITTGDDQDLYTPDWGNVLIINQDMNPDPNDNPWGGEITLDFSALGTVTMSSFKALDFDLYEGDSWVYLYDSKGNEIYKVEIDNLGNSSKQVIDLDDTKGVAMMKVVLDGFNAAGALAGSGAIDDIRFCVEEESTLSVNAGEDKMLTCANPEVTLSGSSTLEGAAFSWTGPEGFTSTSATPAVRMAGTYTLTVTNPATGAAASDQVEVTQNTQIPDVDLSLQPPMYSSFLPCKEVTVTYIAFSFTNDVTYEWLKPDGSSFEGRGLTATEPGLYILTVTNQKTGCQRIEELHLGIASPPDVTVSAGPDQVLTCENKTVTLVGSVTGAVPFIYWYTAEGQQIQYGPQLEVDKPGKYVMWLTEPESGCTFRDTVEVTMDMEAPNISAQGGMLNGEGTLQLKGSSTTEDAAYAWAGPMGFVSEEQNPVVDMAGEYTLTVTDQSNGCTASTTVIVQPQTATGSETIAQVTAFPNPANGKSKVEFMLRNAESYTVTLYDMKGNLLQELKSGQANAGELVSVEVDGDALHNGLYIARIRSESGLKTVKLMVKK